MSSDRPVLRLRSVPRRRKLRLLDPHPGFSAQAFQSKPTVTNIAGRAPVSCGPQGSFVRPSFFRNSTRVDAFADW